MREECIDGIEPSQKKQEPKPIPPVFPLRAVAYPFHGEKILFGYLDVVLHCLGVPIFSTDWLQSVQSAESLSHHCQFESSWIAVMQTTIQVS